MAGRSRRKPTAIGLVSLFGHGATRLHDEVLSVAAQWLEAKSEGHLRPFADQADRRAITTLEQILSSGAPLEPVPQTVQKRVLATAAADFAALWPAVQADAEKKARDATHKLQARGEQEAQALRRIIEAQRSRIERAQQLQLNFDSPTAAEATQLEDEREHMKLRLQQLRQELESEPEQLQALYRVALRRLEPVGLVYLWPTTRL